MTHYYRPGERTGDALAPCLDCGAEPTAPAFAETHEPSRYPTHYPDGTRYLYSAMFGTPEERARDADRAVIARRKAGEKRHIAAIAGTTEWVHDKPNLNDGRLPESAFDWPVYRAALAERFGDSSLSFQARRAAEYKRRLLPHG